MQSLLLEHLCSLQSLAAALWSAAIIGSLASGLCPPELNAFTYGRLLSPRFARFVPSVPKEIGFTSFYAVGVTNAAAWILCAISRTDLQTSYLSVGVLIFYTIHLLRRFFECLCVHRFSVHARMPLHVWLAGLGHYIAVPITMMVPPCCGSESAEGKRLDHSAHFVINPIVVLLLPVLSAIFLWANWLQHKTHVYLASLSSVYKRSKGHLAETPLAPSASSGLRRSSRIKHASSHGNPMRLDDGKRAIFSHDEGVRGHYSFPDAGPFLHVICPHYTYEVIIYACLSGAIMALLSLENCTGIGSLPLDERGSSSFLKYGVSLLFRYHRYFAPLCLLSWVTANLSVTAARTKDWYSSNFPGRRADIARRRPLWPVSPDGMMQCLR